MSNHPSENQDFDEHLYRLVRLVELFTSRGSCTQGELEGATHTPIGSPSLLHRNSRRRQAEDEATDIPSLKIAAQHGKTGVEAQPCGDLKKGECGPMMTMKPSEHGLELEAVYTRADKLLVDVESKECFVVNIVGGTWHDRPLSVGNKTKCTVENLKTQIRRTRG